MSKSSEKKELSNLTLAQLYLRLKEARKKLMNLKKEKIVGKLKNTANIKITKKNIAQILTYIHIKSLDQMEKEYEDKPKKQTSEKDSQ